MHAASRHGTPSLTSLPKDSGVSCFGCSSHPVSDRTQPCLTSVKLMKLAGSLGHSPAWSKKLPGLLPLAPVSFLFLGKYVDYAQ